MSNEPVIVGDSTPLATKLQLEVHNYFVTPLYALQADQYLASVRAVVNKVMGPTDKKQLHSIYPMRQSESLTGERDMGEFIDFIGSTSAQILASQGIDMRLYSVEYHELWCQEHHRHSAMEYHAHSYGSQIVGFYFLDVPKDSGTLCFHDPRAGKQQTTLKEVNPGIATLASNIINVNPREGLLIFTNSWLPHSITRHAGNKPLRFIHFNLGVTDHKSAPTSSGEVTVV